MPRKISQEEAQKIGFVPMGKKHPVRGICETMETGESYHVTRKEFAWKNHTPKRITNEIERKTVKKFSVSKALNNNGWLITRLSALLQLLAFCC